MTDIIKYEGDNSTFVWKHPREDFTSLAQLIVHESQEAVFFMNGQALDSFGPGRFTLETQNLPLLGKMFRTPKGPHTPFHCEVYFINKSVQMAVKWGTDSKLNYLDPNYGIPLEIGACGEMNLAVCDSRKLLAKLVGTTSGIAWGAPEHSGFTKSLQSCFRPLINTAVKAHLISAIKEQSINILEIDEHLETLSSVLRKSILPGFEEYGLTIPQFYITNIALPENDPNFKQLKKLHAMAFQSMYVSADAELARKIEMERQITETEIAKKQVERDLLLAQKDAQITRIAGFAEADVMDRQGVTGRDKLQAQVQTTMAESMGNMSVGGGGSMGDMIGLSMGMAAAGAMAPQMSEMLRPAAPAAPAAATCAKCGATLTPGAKFCFECGEKVAPAAPAGKITCPACGNVVPKGKFCPECGHKFVTECPKCGTALTPGAKFCPECGEKL